MKTIFRPFLLACVLFLAIPGCSLFQSKDDVLYDKALERKKFIEPLQGNYKLIAYEKNGISLLDSFASFKVVELTYNFSIRWSTDKYETYFGSIGTKKYSNLSVIYSSYGTWNAYNMNTHKVDFYLYAGKKDTISNQRNEIELCQINLWELTTSANELNFKLINADTSYLVKFKRS